MSQHIIIVGAGEFGLTAALELRQRGWRVTLLDQGRVPHPDAASTDISKIVRSDYGTDALYTEMGERSIAGWHGWNAHFGTDLYHADGFLVMTPEAMKQGGFEHDSYEFLRARGHELLRRQSDDLRREHPFWNAERYMDGYFNPRGGWAESGRCIAMLGSMADIMGVEILENTPLARVIDNGVVTADGRTLNADKVLLATGAWTPALLPHLQEVIWATGQTVMLFKPQDPTRYQSPSFPVWAADIGRTGWYGFPATSEGIVKVANHGVGIRVDPVAPRVVPAESESVFRRFLSETFPSLADAHLGGLATLSLLRYLRWRLLDRQ